MLLFFYSLIKDKLFLIENMYQPHHVCNKIDWVAKAYKKKTAHTEFNIYAWNI